jgi:predicted dienelactone hydrolase
VPDVRFLLDHLLSGGWEPAAIPDAAVPDAAVPDAAVPDATAPDAAVPDPDRVGIVGHSFGGWTALSLPEVDPRIRAVVALAPGGSANPPPGILRAPLAFRWLHQVPTLYLVADRDTATPLSGMYELYGKTPSPHRMVILHRADHQHFADDVEHEHEALRAMSLPGDAAWLPKTMPPMTELCPGAQAHLLVRGLTLSHFDATLHQHEPAQHLLGGDIAAELAARGVASTVYQP